MIFPKEEKLELPKQVRVTQEVYDILKKQKQKQGISMAKIICTLILEKYGKTMGQ